MHDVVLSAVRRGQPTEAHDLRGVLRACAQPPERLAELGTAASFLAFGHLAPIIPSPMSRERVAVVDDKNRFVRWTDRAEIHAARLPHRSTQVLLFDSDGRLVLQRRHATKLTNPRCWDVSSSGHVEESDYLHPSRPDDDLDVLYDR